MAINRTPVLKRCRQLGLDPIVLGYTGKSKSSSIRQPKRRRKESEYGMQLREKQKAKFVYGVLEKQFHGYFDRAKSMPGITGANLMQILESRLDNVVFRLGFAKTRKEARQIVTHGHIMVNGKRVDIPSYRVRQAILFRFVRSRRNFSSSRALSFPTRVVSFLHGSKLTLKSSRAVFFRSPSVIRSILTFTNNLSSNFTRSN